MSTKAQLIHFERHGWVMQEKVFSASQATAFIPVAHPQAYLAIRHIDAHVGRDPIFLDWIGNTALLEANAQLMGAELHHEGCHAMISSPHPDRTIQASMLRNQDAWGWHRGLRPKWGTHPPRL